MEQGPFLLWERALLDFGLYFAQVFPMGWV